MPDKSTKTLRDMIREASKAPLRDTDFVPAVFAGEGPFTAVIDTNNPSFFAVPASENGGKGMFYVPYGSAPGMVATRAMAYGTLLSGHQKYVPYGLDHMKEISPNWPQVLRRAVGAELMRDAGVSEVAERTHLMQPQTTVFAWAMETLSAMGTPQAGGVIAEAKKFFRDRKYKRQAAMLVPLLRETINAAKRKENLLPYLRILQDLYGTASSPMPKHAENDEIPEPEIPEIPIGHSPQPVKGSLEKFKWGEMETLHPPLLHKSVASGKKSKVWKKAAVGAFRYPWRALATSDLRCFAIKRRVYGGTLLFDFSGSMDLNMNQIETILYHSPEATMAAYGSHPLSHAKGRLVIMAKDGMKADATEVRNLVGQENIVDGPALEWLGSMPEPRIWVSDGHATGFNAEYSDELWEEVARMATKLKIHQIKSAAELIRLLKS